MISSNISQIEVQQFATSDKTQRYIACFSGRHFEISEAVARLVFIMQQSKNPTEISQKYKGANGERYSEAELEKIIEYCIAPILNAPQTPQKHPFLFKVELLSQSAIEQFSNVLKFVFHKPVVIGLILCIFVLEIYFIVNSTALISFRDVNIYVILGALLLLLLSSFVHELGHASACRYFGIRHGGVGFGLYLTFPVFYTDVSETWKLKRKERLIVNMAGVYFQLILLIPFLFIYFITYNHIIKWFLVTVNIGLLVTLNPFFKFDGYWIISDLLGVSNLRKKSGELLRFFIKKLFRREDGSAPYLSEMKGVEKIALVIYTMIVNLFFGCYFLYIIPMFIHRFYVSFPPLVEQLVYRLSGRQAIGFDLIQAIFVQMLFMALIIYLLVRILKSLLSKFIQNKKMIRKKEHAGQRNS
jgi:putative peptide zinc metalloprotease protein